MSIERSASLEPVHHCHQHLTYFVREAFSTLKIFPVAKAQPAGNYELSLHFAIRSASEAKKLLVFASRTASKSLGDITGG